jgi:hypothetical protein
MLTFNRSEFETEMQCLKELNIPFLPNEEWEMSAAVDEIMVKKSDILGIISDQK